MSYIVVVNPAVYSGGSGSTPRTHSDGCFWNSCSCGSMPGGRSRLLAYTVVQALGFSWQKVLAAILVAGVVFLVSTVVRLRAVACRRDSFCLALQLCSRCRTVSHIYRHESNRGCLARKCGSAGLCASFNGYLRVSGDGGADDSALPRRDFGWYSRTAFVAFVTGVAAPPRAWVSLPPSISPILFHVDFRGALNWGCFPIVLTILLWRSWTPWAR
jgi:adenine/guanine/hypoxanthine permease